MNDIIGLSYTYYRPKCFNKSLIKSLTNRQLYINICKNVLVTLMKG